MWSGESYFIVHFGELVKNEFKKVNTFTDVDFKIVLSLNWQAQSIQM